MNATNGHAESQAASVARLRRAADQYEKDGEPGPLGFNCWGWRTIAAELRRVAKEIEIEKNYLGEGI